MIYKKGVLGSDLRRNLLGISTTVGQYLPSADHLVVLRKSVHLGIFAYPVCGTTYSHMQQKTLGWQCGKNVCKHEEQEVRFARVKQTQNETKDYPFVERQTKVIIKNKRFLSSISIPIPTLGSRKSMYYHE